MSAAPSLSTSVRRADDRGLGDHGWLKTRYTFSFADYHDSEHVRFRSLRVLNEDWVAPDRGFPAHPHRDMEILTYVISGSIAHRDSMGNAPIVRAGEVQRMTAGRGVVHSEENPSSTEELHLYQIWIFPDRHGLEPGYEQRPFLPEEKRGDWKLIASADGRGDSLTIHQDAELHATLLEAGEERSYEIRPGRGAWIQVVTGAVTAHVGEDGERVELAKGDGLAIEGADAVAFEASEPAELLLFDLA